MGKKTQNDPLSPTDEIIKGYEQAVKSESQEDSKLASSQDNQLSGRQDSKITSQQVDKSASQISDSASLEETRRKKANKSSLKKATFQISTSVSEALDRLHLQLQLELGKKDAPYKEVIVEEAISQLLEMSEQDKNLVVESLLKRQNQRV